LGTDRTGLNLARLLKLAKPDMHTTAPPTDTASSREASIEKRLARIERSMDQVDQIAAQIPLLMATVTEIADNYARKIPDIDARLEKAMDLVERLTRPQTMESLEKMLDLVEQAPQLARVGRVPGENGLPPARSRPEAGRMDRGGSARGPTSVGRRRRSDETD